MKEDMRMTWFALRPCLSAEGVRNDWFETALAHLRAGGNDDTWHVLMYGA